MLEIKMIPIVIINTHTQKDNYINTTQKQQPLVKDRRKCQVNELQIRAGSSIYILFLIVFRCCCCCCEQILYHKHTAAALSLLFVI